MCEPIKGYTKGDGYYLVVDRSTGQHDVAGYDVASGDLMFVGSEDTYPINTGRFVPYAFVMSRDAGG